MLFGYDHDGRHADADDHGDRRHKGDSHHAPQQSLTAIEGFVLGMIFVHGLASLKACDGNLRFCFMLVICLVMIDVMIDVTFAHLEGGRVILAG